MSQFRPYVSRATRSMNAIKANAKWAWTEHPEESIGFIVIIPTIILGVCKLYYLKKGLTESVQPYYRYRYEVRRPDDPIVLNWRPPSDYPPPYLTNREPKKLHALSP